MNSVHLEKYPDLSFIKKNIDLVETMDLVKEICSCILSLRKEYDIRVRQPLQSATICTKKIENLQNYQELLKNETNIKNINFTQDDFSNLANEKIVINFKNCGKKYGNKIKNIIDAHQNGNFKIINNKLSIADLILEEEDFEIKYTTKENQAVKLTKNCDTLVLVNTDITEELEIEGTARDLVRLIQQKRKDLNLNVTDKINVTIKNAPNFLEKVIKIWKIFIKEQTLIINLQINITNNTNIKDIEILID